VVQSKEKLKSNFFENYKQKAICKLKLKVKEYESCSASNVIYKDIVSIFVDLISWIVIGCFVYVWWQARGRQIDCEMISPEFCNACFTQVNNGLTGLIGG
jgi:hypothetical protein